MADYKELLRRAISALPENNGAARRAVYEKARSALVGQLRAIDPPLPAREITQHRLQLEDCIRQVEQEASEAVITLGREAGAGIRSPLPPAAPTPPVADMPAPPPAEPKAAAPVEAAEPKPVVHKPAEGEEPAKSEGPSSIEDIISQAEAAGAEKQTEAEGDKPEADAPDTGADAPAEAPRSSKPERPIPTIVSRVEVTRNGPTSPVPGTGPRPVNTTSRGPIFEPRREAIPLAANIAGEPVRGGRAEPLIGGGQAAMRQQATKSLTLVESAPVEAALSTVREVEVEPVVNPATVPDTLEAEGAIERAIETLDREARGETAQPEVEDKAPRPLFDKPKAEAKAPVDEAESDAGDTSFSSGTTGRRSGAGLTIFLVVFALLLAGVGGAGFWAWREGYVDLDQMFGQGEAAITETAELTPPPASNTQTLDTTETLAPLTGQPTGPGNTAPATTPEPTTALEGLEEDRLAPEPGEGEATLPEPGVGDDKTEERLPGGDPAVAAVDDPAASVDPEVLAGSQSLLLEASDDGRTGAVPFSGTIEWSEGTDEIGLPTLIGHANIPARNLGVDLTIRKNSDPSLPASHLMEIDFDVSDSFVGGSIAGLPGVLLKNEELVQGTPLVGASARVVGSSFLFALSASDTDAPANVDLLSKRKWMDLAVIYGTGKRAIITLEKDDEAQAMFTKVFDAWSQAAEND